MATLCPQFTTVTQDTQFITKDNVNQLLTNTDDRTVGTTVEVSCFQGYVLQGASSFYCKSDGTWSFTADNTPSCTVAPTSTPAAPQDGDDLDEETKIMIGVVSAVAGVILITLVIMICTIWYRDKKRQSEKRRLIDNFDRDPRRAYMYEKENVRRPGPSTIDLDEPSSSYGYMYYSGDKYRAGSRLSAPMYLPDHNTSRKAGYTEYYDDIKRSRRKERKGRDNLSEPGRQPYVSQWVTRTSLRGSSEYLDKAPIHGRYQGRDPFLWRNA